MSLFNRLTTWVSGQVLKSADLNGEFNNLVNGLNNLDSATTTWTNVKVTTLAPQANVAMNSNKLTGLSAGSANGDSVRFEQVATTASNTALTVTDGSSNAFSGLTTSWWKRYFDASHWEVHIHIEGTSHASATGTTLRVSGFDFTINTGGTAYGPMGHIITGAATDPRGWTSLTLVSSSIISVARSNGAAWSTGTAYSIDLTCVLPI